VTVKGNDFPVRLEEFVPYLISVLADLTARETSDIARHAGGCNLSQWRVLAAVADKPGRTAREIAEMTPLDKAIISRAISALIDRGFLERKHSTEDRRTSHLYLTDRGREKFSEMFLRVNEMGERLVGGLSEAEVQMVGPLLRRLIKNARTPSVQS